MQCETEPSVALAETVLDACGDALVSIDARGVVTTWNPAAERVVGRSAIEIVGQSLRQCVPTGDEQAWGHFLAQTSVSDAPHTWETQWRRPDGSLVDVELVIAPIREPDSAIMGSVIVVRDISERKHAEEVAAELVTRLKIANDVLERLNAMKTSLVATISHEFRTPLTSIQGFSELIETEPLTRHEIRAFAQTINQNALRLSRMISDQLDLETLEAGQWPMCRTAVPLNVLVERVVSSLQPIAKNHCFVTELAPDLPDIKGDPDLLERVIMNIVANAIKYSPAGGAITIRTTGCRDGVGLSIADQGLGVPEEDRQQIFAPYGRVGRPEHMSIAGTGLGLPIARQILEVHHGRIWVEPNSPRGSVFKIVVPVSDPRPE
jgi:PAS domain S-box-containing protein